MAQADVPEQPGWYTDARGAWWWWDGRTWTPAPAGAGRPPERGQALLVWILYLVGGGWVASLIFYLVAKDKPFVRHHAAESLNLTLVVLVPQLLGVACVVPVYVDILTHIDESGYQPDFGPLALVGFLLIAVAAVWNIVAGIQGAIRAHRGRWDRLALPFHPVRGTVRPGEEPYAPT